MTPVAQCIYDVPLMRELKTCNTIGKKTLLWESVPPLQSTYRTALVEKFSQNDWMVFFTAISKGPLALTSLNLLLPFCPKESLSFILQKAPELKRLQLGDFSTEDLKYILAAVGKFSRQLSELLLPDLARVKDLDLTLLNSCKQLSVLQVNCCGAALEQGLLLWLIESGNSLTSLDLSQCSNITETTLESLNHTTPSLTKLNITGCPYLQSSSLCLLDPTKLKIRQLVMHEIGLTSETVICHMQFFSQLEELSLVDCQLSSETCQLLANHCPLLKKLNLRGNSQISFGAAESIVRNLSQLQVLDLLGIPLSAEEVARLKEYSRALKIIDQTRFSMV